MRRLAIADLRASWRIWLGAFVALAVVQLLTSWMGSVALVATTNLDLAAAQRGIGTASSGDAQIDDNLIALGTVSAIATAGIIYVLVTIATVGSVTALVVTQRRRLIALWQLSGMTDRQVRRIVTQQLLLVTLAATVVALGLAAVTMWWVIDQVRENGLLTDTMSTAWAWPGVLVGMLVGVLIVALSTRRAAKAIAKIAPLEVITAAGTPDARMTVIRAVAAIVLAAGGVFFLISTGDSTPIDGTQSALLGMLLSLFALTVSGPWSVIGFVRGWTALVPRSASASWHLARTSLLAASVRTLGAIAPIAITIVLAIGTLSISQAIGRGLGGEADSIFSIVVLVGLPMTVAATGAVVMVFMAGQKRERELALAALAGATPGQQLRQAAFEAVIVSVTGTVIGLVVALLGVLSIQPMLARYGTAAFAFAWWPFVFVVGVLLIANLLATLIPTILSMSRNSARLVAAS